MGWRIVTCFMSTWNNYKKGNQRHSIQTSIWNRCLSSRRSWVTIVPQSNFWLEEKWGRPSGKCVPGWKIEVNCYFACCCLSTKSCSALHFGVHERYFQVRLYVLRETTLSKPDQLGKLMPNWEGPYNISSMPHLWTYKLENIDGTPIKNTWNIVKLKKYYP